MPKEVDKALREKIGANIVKAREDKNIKSSELAKALGIGPDLMSKCESGERPVHPEMLMCVAKKLGISLDALFGISSDLILPEVQGVGVEINIWDPFLLNCFIEELKYLEQERDCLCQRVITPLLYAPLQTNQVSLNFWLRNYQYLYDDDFFHQDELIKGRELRRQELYKSRRTVYQIGSEIEMIKFAKGDPPYENLSLEARLDQLQHLMKILDTYPLRIYFGLINVPLVVEYSIYNDTRVVIKQHYNHIEIQETQVAEGMLNNFAGLWRNTLRGKELRDFLKEQIQFLN